MPVFSASYQKYTLRFKKPAGTSRGELRTKEVYFLRLSRAGAPRPAGLGECAPWPGLSFDDRPDFEQHVAEVCRRINAGENPVAMNLTNLPALAFGLETALLDLRGGGVRRLFDTPFSRGEASLPTHGLIWLDSPAGILRQVRQKAAAGFTTLKMKVGGLDFEREIEILAEIRRLCPPGQFELRLDANGAFSPENALPRLNQLARFHIHSIEQPLKPGQENALAELCARSPIPVALDEELIGHHSFAGRRRLLETIRPQAIVLKPALLGGLAAAEAWISLAGALDIGWWANSALESNIGLNALCQWVSAVGRPFTHGLGTGRLYANNIPSPLRLEGANLMIDRTLAWDVSEIAG